MMGIESYAEKYAIGRFKIKRPPALPFLEKGGVSVAKQQRHRNAALEWMLRFAQLEWRFLSASHQHHRKVCGHDGDKLLEILHETANL